MRYRLAPLHCRPWTLNGISARLIESHYENNYGGALNRLNAISEEIERLDLGSAPNPSLARLKRDEIVALNSTLLHELYFASLGGDGRVVQDALASAIAKDFGSVDRWRQEFVGIASGLAGGSGWVLLTYVPRGAFGCEFHSVVALSSLSARRMMIVSASSGNGRCSAFAIPWRAHPHVAFLGRHDHHAPCPPMGSSRGRANCL
jgi:superoxide dismutase